MSRGGQNFNSSVRLPDFGKRFSAELPTIPPLRRIVSSKMPSHVVSVLLAAARRTETKQDGIFK